MRVKRTLKNRDFGKVKKRASIINKPHSSIFMAKISFGTPIETMGPYYSEADLNDQPASAESIAFLEKLIDEAEGSLACEIKEDGFRCQAHVDGKRLRLFTRGSGEFEARCFPEITEALLNLNLKKTIFDGELRGIASKYGGFKAIQARARYKGKISEKAVQEYLQTKPGKFPLQLVVFDVLMGQGNPLISESNRDRRTALEEMLGENRQVIPASRTIAESPEEIVALYAQKIRKEKYEGLVLKQLNLEYLPGDKSYWVKLKKFEPLDLVILGLSKGGAKDAAYGQALVGSYHPNKGVYQALGFVNLVRQNQATNNLFAHDISKRVGKKVRSPPRNIEIGAAQPEVYVQPNVVLEVRAMNLERGNNFACSLDGKTFYSLRIAYVKSIRGDKKAVQATTTEMVAQQYKMQR